MLSEELKNLIEFVCKNKTETQTLEIKSAHNGYPGRLHDTLSSFSNQDSGGIILFGIDEEQDFAKTGVYDPHDLQKHVTEQCNQMTPPVRPLFTTCEEDGMTFVSAEIPALDIAERPCFYAGKGRLAGSYVRVGDADQRMTEYEIYRYEAFRKRYQDEVMPVPQSSLRDLNEQQMAEYLHILKENRPNLARLDDSRVMELTGLTRDGIPTLVSLLLFGLYPQAHFPQLAVMAVAVPGTSLEENALKEVRFLDNRRIEGTIPQMFEQSMAFLQKNMSVRTVIDQNTGRRNDRYEYPLAALREAVLNALVHRDYSIYTLGKPIRISLYADRLEIASPGGLYGRLRVEQLGRVQPDTRNPVLATALETLRLVKNRYSGIPTIRAGMKEHHLPEPLFEDFGDHFVVTLKNHVLQTVHLSQKEQELLNFCAEPRSRLEIAAFLGLKSASYALKVYVNPLMEKGLLRMTLPDTPASPRQRYMAN